VSGRLRRLTACAALRVRSREDAMITRRQRSGRWLAGALCLVPSLWLGAFADDPPPLPDLPLTEVSEGQDFPDGADPALQPVPLPEYEGHAFPPSMLPEVTDDAEAETYSNSDLLNVQQRLAAEAELAPAGCPSGWWDQVVAEPLRRDVQTLPLTLEQVLMRTLRHSHQVRVFSELPLIRETAIIEADAAFDWTAFLESRWNDNNDPVGSTLTAGPGITRYVDRHWTFSGGLRKKVVSGGLVEARQDFGFQNTNSTFFVPNPQGTSRIGLSFTQPLLRGHGEVYNTSLICLASIDADIARDEFCRQLQSHLLEVTRAYWGLYLERGVLYQKLNSYLRAEEIVTRLEGRRELDASETQIRTAQATLADRRSELLRAETAVRNAEARLRALVNDPEFGQFDTIELVPLDLPTCQLIPLDMHQSLGEAVCARPEVTQSIKQIRAAAVRLDMSDNELLPLLNLVAETYVAGLAPNGNMNLAWGNQFDQGQPGYALGLQFEAPLGNRAAKARMQRRQLELRQLQSQYQVTLQTVGLEVEVAVREVETSQREMLAKAESVAARELQLVTLEERWDVLPHEDLSATLMLENIITAQDRLAEAEFGYLQAQVTYNLSLMNLKRATGALLQHELVSINRYCQCGVPTQSVSKPDVIERHFADEVIEPEQAE
jgi:outer membrane protein